MIETTRRVAGVDAAVASLASPVNYVTGGPFSDPLGYIAKRAAEAVSKSTPTSFSEKAHRLIEHSVSNEDEFMSTDHQGSDYEEFLTY